MRRCGVVFWVLVTVLQCALFSGAQRAFADTPCFNAGVAVPTPNATGQITAPVCINGKLQVDVNSGTPQPQPTQPYQVNVANTPGVTVQNTPTVIIANPSAFPTPIPFPTLGVVCISGCPTPLPAPTLRSGTILTPASATTCTNLQAVAGNGIEIINSGPATTIFPQFYSDAGATCAAGTLLYGDGSTLTIYAGQIIKIDFPVSGIAVKLSGALTSNLLVTGL